MKKVVCLAALAVSLGAQAQTVRFYKGTTEINSWRRGDVITVRIEINDKAILNNSSNRSRQANGAANVGAHMQRAVARGGGGARAGARSAWALAQIPGVARQRVKARQSRGQHAVVGHGGLAENHRTGFHR